MEDFLNLIAGYFGDGLGKLPYISRIHTAYVGEDSSLLGTTSMFGDFHAPKLVRLPFCLWILTTCNRRQSLELNSGKFSQNQSGWRVLMGTPHL